MTDLELLQINNSIENESMRVKLKAFFVGAILLTIGLLLLGFLIILIESHIIWIIIILILSIVLIAIGLLFLSLTFYTSNETKVKRAILKKLKSGGKVSEELLEILFSIKE